MQRKVKHLFLLIFGFICLNLAVKIFHSIKVTKQRSFLVFRDIFYEDRAIINTEKINLLCIVLTSPTSVYERVGSLYETWAKKCNKTIFACNCNSNSSSSHANSTKENLNLIKSLEFLNLTKQESYDRMAEKVMDTIKLSYDIYGQNYNWFLLVDDDTFIFHDNLIKFIRTKSSKRAFTYGYNFKSVVSTGYQSGGAGVLITKESMKRLHKKISEDKCIFEKTVTGGYGDVALGLCSKIADVRLGYSLDSMERERFHPLDPSSHYTGDLPAWIYEYASNKVQIGINCCSNESISFHYIDSNYMLFLKKLQK